MFLWFSVISWGIGLGAKVFDLVVLARAWGLEVPSSLVYYPYGRHWPVNPGDFFQPLSALILTAILGALISGWKTEPVYKFWLGLSFAAFVAIWIATPTLFWPLITQLYRVANRRVTMSDDAVATLVRHWFIYDWIRVAMIAVGFLASIRAISIPYLARSTSDSTYTRNSANDA
jgi:hypothetical protein